MAPPASTRDDAGSRRKPTMSTDAFHSADDLLDSRARARATRAAEARAASGRRRHVDPTTCERDYSEAEMEFMRAMQEYKRRSGRMFPTWGEVLEVIKDLGYRKQTRSPSGTWG